jgi:DMSO/TMAO reductase YedYZ molybdopterin-dependent catalytic subunit
MKQSKLLTFGFLVLVISTIIFLSGCIQQEEESVDYVEIKDYEGEKLLSIDDFRENSIKGPQHIEKESYALRITGLVANPKSYSYDEIVDDFQTHKKVVRLDCVEGWSVTIFWEGVLVRDVIKDANHASNATVVIFHAYDGYTTSFPLDYIQENDIIMAYKMNNVTLPPERGFPFQLVAESKWGYKWIKWITEIELSDDVNYRGYWESRGYSNTADLNESFIGR